MTREELLDLLTVERFAPRAATSPVPRLDDPDAARHVDELLAALSTDESPDCAHDSTVISPAFRRRPQGDVDESLSTYLVGDANGHQEQHRKGA